MAPLYKLLSNTMNLTSSANTIFNGKLVRLLAKSPILITQTNSLSNTQQGTLIMNGNTEMTIQKRALDTLTSNDATNCLAVSISFTN